MSCVFYFQRMALLFLIHIAYFFLYSLADMIPELQYFLQRVSMFLSYILQLQIHI